MSRIAIHVDGKALDTSSDLDDIFYLTKQKFDIKQ